MSAQVSIDRAKEFDRIVKRNLASGKEPERAIDDACTECGLTVTPDQKKAILELVAKVQKQTLDPEHVRKRTLLTERINHLLKREGLSVQKAVKQAQEDTGVKLGEQGENLLIQVLEQEAERLKDMRVEVVSDGEFKQMQAEVFHCINLSAQGLRGWVCCECNRKGTQSLNELAESSCRKCGHSRCKEASLS